MRLADFQDAFAQALTAEDAATAAPALARLTAQPGFAVYRNTVLRGCIDALQANFPAVTRLVGEAWFRAAAALYARDNLPQSPVLLTYGESFPEFLAHFPPAAELPYLAAVARIDRLWTETHVAADDDALEPADLAQLAPHDLAHTGLRLHPGTRWFWCDAHPVESLWRHNRHAASTAAAQIEWRAEGVLLTRQGGAVRYAALSREGAAFLDAAARGQSVEAAVGAALYVNPAADLAALINQLLQAGAFAGLSVLCAEEIRP